MIKSLAITTNKQGIRYGLFRPTENVEIVGKNGQLEYQDFPEWKSMGNIHLDLNPWAYVKNIDTGHSLLDKLTYRRISDFIEENNHPGLNKEVNAQGVINFRDNREEDGGLHVVPKFPHKFEGWANETYNTLRKEYGLKSTFIVLYDIEDEPVRISAPAGCVIVWDQRTVHGSAPNASPNAR